MRFQSICHMINRIEHSCSCIIEFIKLIQKELKCSASLAFYLFSASRLMNSIQKEHSCKILYLMVVYFLVYPIKKDEVSDSQSIRESPETLFLGQDTLSTA